MAQSNRILLVDNSPFFLNILREAIQAKCNFEAEILTASSRAEANYYIEHSQDWLVVVSGYELPDATRGELIKDTLRHNIPVIVLTSTATDSDRERALQLNIVDYFPKDVNCFSDVAGLIDQLKDNNRHKILIIDDSPAFCGFAHRLLSSQNYRVSTCNTASEAIDIIKEQTDITLTLIDYILPDLDGSQLIPRIRKIRDANSLPIISISAFNEKSIAARMIKSGANDFLLKPIDHEELLLRIRNSLKLQDQFNQTEKARIEAQRANEAKSYFLSRISHELRTPLNAIIGFSQLLATDDGLNEEQRDCIDEIDHASGHLLHLINEVLDLSHIESGNIELHLGPVNVHQLASDTCSMLQSLADKQNIMLTLSELSEPNSDKILTDPHRLKQILINLISNGIKYNKPNGQLNINITPQADKICIDICDTGVGIPPDRLDSLFDPFTRAHTDKYNIEGNGLGLSICLRLIQLLAGKIRVQSEVNKGSTFSIELPYEPPVSLIENGNTTTTRLSPISSGFRQVI
ncbi:response regulator [Oceanospirillum beijerinckii]|uniref:response regulator n=1 Tax=Oceanospirillum beijerinckii TaxID=64976 RepID=UPI00041A4A22|nr:response regulator [Oceanospirillum beijerinckii]